MITPIVRTILSGFISGFQAAERAKNARRYQRVYRFLDNSKKQSKLTIQGIRSPYKNREEHSYME